MAGPGRPKRQLAATSKTANNGRPRWVNENAVLKPKDPDVPDNDWPVFVLKDATIYRMDGRTLANPLMAHIEGPYVIRGVLEVDDPDLYPHLVKQSVKTAAIEVQQCRTYAVGDGPVALWVSGESGWFEIRPSVKYQPVYNEVVEAINLYYGIFVAYEEYYEDAHKKKKGKKPEPPTLDQLFYKYAKRVGNGIVRDEVEALCHKWAEWLIAHFSKEVQLDWNKTRFANWVKDSHPDLVKKVDDATKGLIPPAPLPELPPSSPEPEATYGRKSRSSKSRSVQSRDSSDVEMKDAVMDKSRALPTRPLPLRKENTKVETPVPIPEKYRNWGAASANSTTPSASPAPTHPPNIEPASDSPLDHILSAIIETAQEVNVHTSSAARVANSLFFKCKLRTYHGAKEVAAYYAKDILPRLGPEWNGTPWQKWLQEVSVNPPEFHHVTVEEIPLQAVRRNKGARATPKTTSVSEVPPVINLGKRAPTSSAPGSEVPGNHTQSLLRNRSSGKRATLRLVGSKKRPAYVLEEDLEETGSRGRKSSKRAHQHVSDNEDMDDASSEDDSSTTADVDDEADPYDNPVESQLPAPKGTSRLVLVAERLPTMSPTGPNGTWVCDHEGCDYIVRGAEEPAGQASIQEHFAEHEAQAAKIDLAKKESRGQMPIKNLLDKIQGIGEQVLRRKRGTLNGDPLPAPIKRKFLL